MLQIRKEGILLHKRDLTFEQGGVLNPGAWQNGNNVHLLYRAVAPGNFSTVGYCRLEGPMTIVEQWDHPLLDMEGPLERHGAEDPRIVKIDDTWYLTYTAYDGMNALGCLATSTDFKNWERRGVIVPRTTTEDLHRLTGFSNKIPPEYFRFPNDVPLEDIPGVTPYFWNKDLLFFPRRINGKLVFLHRMKPDIQIVEVNELSELTPEFWEEYTCNFSDYIFMRPGFAHEIAWIGAGAPPIETPHGWLNIYHGVYHTNYGNEYTACASLHDLDNPRREISRLPHPLFYPEHEWEKVGEVNNVCFPTGTAIFDDRLYIYYGAADERVAVASVEMQALIDELLKYAKM